jgi:hypothetical protein
MKSWKTTLMGLVTAVAVAVYPIITTGVIDWKNVGLAALIAVFGYLAKDYDVTGKP